MLDADRKEFIRFLELFDLNSAPKGYKALVVPELVVQEFRSSRGLSFDDMLLFEDIKKRLSSLQSFPYRNLVQTKETPLPPIPDMPNNVVLWIYQPSRKQEGMRKLTVIVEKNTQDIMKIYGQEHRSVNPEEIEQQLQQLKHELSSQFPEYYMNFTVYGSVVYGLATGEKSFLNVNIELDQPDLDRLVNRSSNPLYEDRCEPHCVKGLSLLGTQPELLDSAFNTTRVELSRDDAIEYSFNKSIVTTSSRLIEEYIRMDPRVHPFLFAIKRFVETWPRAMSSYGFMIMGLSYLTSLDQPVIPNLQNITNTETDSCYDNNCLTKWKYWDYAVYQGKYTGAACRFHTCVEARVNGEPCKYSPVYDRQAQKFTWTSSNKQTVGRLLIDFMYHYGYAFNFDENAVSLKHTGMTPRKEIYANHQYVIEDPIVSGDNLGKDIRAGATMITRFRKAFADLLYGELYSQILKKNRTSKVTIPHPTQAAGMYTPLTRVPKPNVMLKCLLVMGLPKYNETTEGCDCDFLRGYFSSQGRVHDMKYLDNETMLVNLEVLKPTALAVEFPYKENTIYMAELLNFLKS